MNPVTANQHAQLPAGYVGAAVAAFATGELIVAVTLAFAIEILFFAVLVRAGSSAEIREEEVREAMPIPISVKPVLDDTPLLKLGGKKLHAKLPDMWQKQAPIKRFQARSAPSPDAKNDVEAIPQSEVATGDAGVPPPDAEVAKEVDEELQPEAGSDAASTVEGEGSPDGVKEGTETDPMKARWVSQYQMKVLAWFNARFTPPSSGAPCEQLKKLRAAVAANVGGDRTVIGYVLTASSGNPTFDAKVRATMDGIVGQQIPPPPPLLTDARLTVVTPVFSGSKSQCKPAASPSPPSSASP